MKQGSQLERKTVMLNIDDIDYDSIVETGPQPNVTDIDDSIFTTINVAGKCHDEFLLSNVTRKFYPATFFFDSFVISECFTIYEPGVDLFMDTSFIVRDINIPRLPEKHGICFNHQFQEKDFQRCCVSSVTQSLEYI